MPSEHKPLPVVVWTKNADGTETPLVSGDKAQAEIARLKQREAAFAKLCEETLSICDRLLKETESQKAKLQDLTLQCISSDAQQDHEIRELKAERDAARADATRLREALAYMVDCQTPGRIDGPGYHHEKISLAQARAALAAAAETRA